MPKFLRSLLVAAVVTTAAGCAHTQMTSMPAPELRGRSFQAILVVAQIADLGLRIEMENRFTVQMPSCVYAGDSLFHTCRKPLAARFVASHTVFFPGREYNSEQVIASLREHGIDATLLIAPGEAGRTQGYVPPTYTTQCTVFVPSSGCTLTTTTASGGFSYSSPWAQFSAKLYNAANGEVVWVATATAGGNAFAQSADLVRSMADKTRERLAADKVIQ